MDKQKKNKMKTKHRRPRHRRRPRVPYKRAETLYETLGLLPIATTDEIKRARRFLLKRTHPDRNKSQLAKIHWECLDKACDILLNEKDRIKYDRLLRMRLLPDHGDVNTDFTMIRHLLDNTL